MPGPWKTPRGRDQWHGKKWHGGDWHGDDWHSDDWSGGRWQGGPPTEWRMPRSFTLWAPVVVSFLAQVPAAVFLSRSHDLGPRATAIAVLLAIAGPLALIAARRFPGPVVAVVSALAALDLFISELGGPPYVALSFAIVGAIARGARVWAWISVGVSWTASVIVGIALNSQNWTPGRIALTTLGILIVFGVGENLRTRRERVAEFRRLQGERRQSAVQAERVRIARELHDVLAHSLSQINVQAGVGLHLMDSQPDKAADALASIKETSKTALDEVRSVLGMLRSEPGDHSAPLVPEPDLSRLPALIASASSSAGASSASAGAVSIRLDDQLTHTEVPGQIQLALYRIAQESLTNVSRHAQGATTVAVTLHEEGGRYLIEVRDDGTGAASGPHHTASETGGRGVLGMRERAELLGGHLSAGPAAGGGFVVSAEIPPTTRPRTEETP